jgi:hypothetical protein
MKRKICSISFLLVAAIQSPSLAGGMSWDVRIEKVQVESPDRVTLYLQKLKQDSFSPACSQMSVDIDFRPPHFWESKHPTSDEVKNARQRHREALLWLQKMAQEHPQIRFGEMGGGLIQKQVPVSVWDFFLQSLIGLFQGADLLADESNISPQCQFLSRRLAVKKENSGQYAVYAMEPFL